MYSLPPTLHIVQAFGLSGLSEIAIACHAAILPQAILQYGQGMTLDPKLEGSQKHPLACVCLLVGSRRLIASYNLIY